MAGAVVCDDDSARVRFSIFGVLVEVNVHLSPDAFVSFSFESEDMLSHAVDVLRFIV